MHPELGGHRNVDNSTICCGFFWTGFQFSYRRQYSESLLWSVGLTPLMITGGSQIIDLLSRGDIFSNWLSLLLGPCMSTFNNWFLTHQCLLVLWCCKWPLLCWLSHFNILCIIQYVSTRLFNRRLYPAAWIVLLNFLCKFVTSIFVNGAWNKEHLSHFYDN